MRRARWFSGRDDGGFTLAEIAVALGVVAVVLAGLAPFIVHSVSRLDLDRRRQAAVRIADDAAERARAAGGATIFAGRGNLASAGQWAAAPAPVRPFLDRLQRAWDPDPLLPAGAGAGAALPTVPRPVVLDGVTYGQNWYVGRCRQQGGSGAAERSCEHPGLPDPAPARPDVPMIAIVVSVTWPQRQCSGGTCVYVISTYVSGAEDPVFPVGS